MDEKEKLEFEKSLEIRQFEIDLFWKRAWFFGALLVALVTGFITLKNTNHPLLSISLVFIIFLVTLAQTLMNRGSKYWQERWEFKTKNRESRYGVDITKTQKYPHERYYIDATIRAKGENFLTRGHRFSVSKLTFLIWDIITIFFFSLWLNEIASTYFAERYNSINSVYFLIAFHFVILVYSIVFFKTGKAYESLLTSKNNSVEILDSKYKKDAEDYLNNSSEIYLSEEVANTK
jgi:hypothetical protein